MTSRLHRRSRRRFGLKFGLHLESDGLALERRELMAYTPIADVVEYAGFGWDVQAATAPNGITTIVWQFSAGDGEAEAIYGRRVDSSGQPLGAAFRIDDQTYGNASHPTLDVDDQGNALVMWKESFAYQNEYSRLLYQRYDAQGVRVGGNEMLLNESLESLESMVHLQQDGGFAILTYSSSKRSFLYLRFDAAGDLQEGNEFERDDLIEDGWYITSTSHAISAADDDGTVLVWSEFRGRANPDGNGYLSDGRVWARRIAANGAVIGEDILVAEVLGSTDGSAGIEMQASATSLAGGGFLIAWDDRSTRNGTSYATRRGRIFDASGSPVGGVVELSPETKVSRFVRTTQLADGTIAAFTVLRTPYAWDVFQYQIFSAAGEALTGSIQADAYLGYETYGSQIIATPGGFLFIWQEPINNNDSQIKILAYGDETRALESPTLILADRDGGVRAWGDHVAIPIGDGRDAENAVIAPDGRVYIDFGSRGLWVRKGEKLVLFNAADPEGMIIGGDGLLYIDYGRFGLWRSDGSSLKRINAANPEGFAATPDGTLYVDFGPFGLWRRTVDGNFQQLNEANPDGFVATTGGTLFIDYGRFGLWRADASGFVQINQADPESLAVSPDGSLYIDFGRFGLWRWNGRTTQINGADPEAMAVTSDGVLHIDFGSFGLWSWSTTTGISQDRTDDPTELAAGRDGFLYVVFGPAGVWRLSPDDQFQLVDPSRPRRIFA